MSLPELLQEVRPLGYMLGNEGLPGHAANLRGGAAPQC